MNSVRKITVLSMCLLASLVVNAQGKLHIETLFDSYGKREGSILIELGKDVLGNHTQITHYKSLIISADPQTEEIIKEAIQKDIVGGKILMELTQNGKEKKAYYSLKIKEDTTQFEYILFTTNDAKTTLVYVKGTFSPDRLQRELGKLKDLFIQVNNKRISLQ